MPHITDKLIRNMPSPAQGQKIHRDTIVTGFGVRKTATGHTAFIFNYTSQGRDRRMTIGQYPAWSVVAARQAAARLRVRVDASQDPMEDQRLSRAEYTLQQLWERYDATVLVKKAESTQRDMRSIWKRIILPKLGRRRLSDIRVSDIEDLHLAVSEKTPVQANRCTATVRHAFNKAIRWDLTSMNPAKGVEKNDEAARARYLDDVERSRFFAALNGRDDTPSLLALNFLLLTGARRGEVLKARWDQIDFVQEAWVKPSANTKQRRLHRVPLSKAAINILHRARDCSDGDYVFPGRTGVALTEIKKSFYAVCREAGINGLRIHDLRHSYASALVSRGTSLPIIGGLLGHTQVSTTARYSHLADDAMRRATNRHTPAELAVLIAQKIGLLPTAGKASDIPPPASRAMSGEVTFDYGAFNGLFVIGCGAAMFETKWSKSSDTNICLYNDPPSINGVAIAKDAVTFEQLADASIYDFTSRTRRPKVGEIAVLRNTNGFYAALQIVNVEDDTRGAAADAVTVKYVIQSDGSANFAVE